jgi:uncharacterized protein YbjT (DUF2867 family)
VLTGEGVAEALQDAHALVDVLNSPSFGDEPVLDFFSTATRNLVGAARSAGVAQYVALSIVGDVRLPDSGYMRAKVAQETLIETSGLPYTIVRATQFIEFDGDVVRVRAGGCSPRVLIGYTARRNSAGTVRARILMSRPSDQFSM